MAITTVEQEIKRLRSYLNPYMKGKTVDAVLEALAIGGSSHLIEMARQVHDQLFVVTASGRYLDERLSEHGITRPPAVGLSDDVFREIGIQVANRKQVRDLINQLLNSIFGDEFVRASNQSRMYEPYNLQDGDQLIINFDANSDVFVTFDTADFQSIAAATAQEVADAITKSLRNAGKSGTAIAKDDGNGPYVEILSDTIGPASSVTIFGGRAQNVLKFDSIVPAGGNMSTQWTLSLQPGGIIRFTWSAGANPQLGKVSVGNYANIFGGGFTSSSNEGSYTIANVVGGTIGNAYFEIENPLGTSGIVTQGTDDAILFFSPSKKTLNSRLSYAAVFQTEAKILQIFMPAATKVIRRERKGAAHLHDPADPDSLLPNQPGPYMYDTTQSFTVSNIGTTLTQSIDGTSNRLVNVTDSSSFPDSQGYLMLSYGYDEQEGPIPYIARPSSTTLLVSPAYNFKNSHISGRDVALVAERAAPNISRDGLDYPFYLTDTVSGRLYAQDLINSIVASGITVVYTILLPSDEGLGKWSTAYSENLEVWS